MEILEQGPGQGPGQQQQADRPRITTRYLTKYEKARVLGTRALQASGAARLRARRDSCGLGLCTPAPALRAWCILKAQSYWELGQLISQQHKCQRRWATI